MILRGAAEELTTSRAVEDATGLAAPTETWDAFISYAPADKAWVRLLAENLHRLGVAVFFDKWEVEPGAVVSTRLDEGLRRSRSGILVVSRASVLRPWVMEEYAVLLHGAVEGRQRLIPVLYEDAEMPAMLRTRAWIDFRRVDARSYVDGVVKLVAALRGEPPARPRRGEPLRIPWRTRVRSLAKVAAVGVVALVVASAALLLSSTRILHLPQGDGPVLRAVRAGSTRASTALDEGSTSGTIPPEARPEVKIEIGSGNEVNAGPSSNVTIVGVHGGSR